VVLVLLWSIFITNYDWNNVELCKIRTPNNS